MSEPSLYGGLQPSSSLRFNITAGPRAGQRLEIPATNSITLGRNRDCVIYIESADVSRHHAEIFLTPEGRYFVRDLGSRNGTLVDGRPATQANPLPLNPGTMITTGTTLLIFEGFHAPTMLIDHRLNQDASAHTDNSVVSENVQASLILTTGQHFVLEGEQLTVGRAVTNQVVIEAKSISRYHARLQRTAKGYTVIDLGSTNKTFVNNKLADSPILLYSGDVVRFGDVVTTYELKQIQPLIVEPVSEVDTTNPDEYDVPEIKTHLDFPASESQPRRPKLEGETVLNENQARRRNLEHGETRLNFDVRDFRNAGRGRALPNQPSAALNPASAGPISVVSLDRVSKSFSANILLQNVNLALRQSELVSMLGPDTFTKNILERILVALEPADKGIVQILGRTLPVLENRRGLNLEEDGELYQWRTSNIGYLSPDISLNNRLSVLEAVSSTIEQITGNVNRASVAEQALEQLRAFGVARPDLDKVHPDDLKPNERLKVALARVFAPGPAFTVLHEPTAKLNTDEVSLIVGHLKLLTKQGKTIVVFTQDRLWERLANRNYELSVSGEIIGG